MSESALPPCDRSEEPDPPRPKESRSDWIRRMARDLYGTDLDKPEAREARRRRASFEERLEAIWAGRDPDAREPGQDDE